MTSSYNKSLLVGGAFQDSSGSPLSLGTLTWTLSHDSNISTLGSPTGFQVAAGTPISINLDMLGNASPNQYLWANSVLTPVGSYYLVQAYDSSGIEIWSSPQTFSLLYQPTIDLGTLTPNLP